MKLSEKEIRFIELKSQGFTNQEISRIVFSNIKSVKMVFHDLYRKTGTRNAAHLTKWAIENTVLQIKFQKSNTSDDKAA